MDNKKTDQYYIKKVVTDLSFIVEHTGGLSKADLQSGMIFLSYLMS